MHSLRFARNTVLVMGDDHQPSSQPPARRQYTCDTRARAQLSSRVDVGVFTHVRTQVHSLSLHAPAVDCLWNDDCVTDGGAFLYLN